MRGFLAACALASTLALARPASSAPTWNLSLPADSTERAGLEQSRALFERTLSIELRDETIVGRPGETSDAVALYVRVSYETVNLRVEVWDRGDPAGARVVSGHGAPALVARRVALTTVELVRKLSQRRSTEHRKALAEEVERRREETARQRERERERPRLVAALRGGGLPSAGAALGPELGVTLNGDDPLRFGVGLGYGLGVLSALRGASGSGVPSFSLWSVELSASYVFRGPKNFEFSLGPSVRASALHVGAPAELGSTGNEDALTAQAGLFLQFEPRLSERLGAFLRADGAIVLSPIDLRSDSADARWEGLALGLTLGASLGL